MGDLKMIFGSAVKSKRFALGLSQEELAERAGLHRTYVSDVERGARNPSLGSIEKLAIALELPVAGLFPHVDPVRARRELVEILLVQNDREEAELTACAFRKAGVINALRVISDSVEAADYLFGTGNYAGVARGKGPGVILLDLDLPGISGLELLRRIRRDRRTQDIPVVVLTSSPEHGDVASCREFGATTYIVKPISFGNFSEVTPHFQLEWILARSQYRETN